MKNLLHWFRRVATSALVCALLGTPLAAQPKTPAPGEITWQQAPSPELNNLHVRYDEIVRRDGNAKSDDARDLEHAIANMEGRLPWVLSFNFPGGPLSKFLALISKANVVSFNIICTGDQTDLETMLPPFTLHNAPIGTIRHVLHNLLLPHGLTLNPAEGGNDQQIVGVLTRLTTGPSKSAPPPTFFDSFPLAPYLNLKEQSVDDIIGAIRAGWELDPAHDKDALRLKFHPATSILLVSGPPEATMIAAKVISQLRRPVSILQRTDLQPQTTPPPEATKR